jgi:hypothetical protein
VSPSKPVVLMEVIEGLSSLVCVVDRSYARSG